MIAEAFDRRRSAISITSSEKNPARKGPSPVKSSPAEQADLVVVGSGAGGLSAALVGALEGLDVVLIEKTGQFGGTTAVSGGAVWIVDSRHSRAAGLTDNVEKGREYLRHELGNHYRADLAEAFLENGARSTAYLEAKSAVQFDLFPIPDYHADAPGGAVGGRTLMTRPFDGRLLGKAFNLLRPPLDYLTILGGMMIGRDEADLLSKGLTPKSVGLALRLLVRHGRDRLRFSRGTRLIGGNALVARFLHSLIEHGVALRPNESLVRLVSEAGRITGVVIAGSDGERFLRARLGVVLATGGPAHDPSARAEFMSAFPHSESMADAANTGDGFRLARAIGAAVDSDVATPAVWTPGSRLVEAGRASLAPYGFLDRGKPGAIAVDRRGRRFCNEADSYQDVVVAMYANRQGDEPVEAHLVFDSQFLWKYGAGMVRPRTRMLGRWLRSRYLKRGSHISDLAASIGVDGAALEATVARHNSFAEAGVDLDFGKGESTFNRYNGDPAVTPNPCLAPIVAPPFYALKIQPMTLGMSLGLRTDGHGRVLDESSRPIEGLYACGNEMGAVMRGYCPAGGITLGPAITFGYLAARHAAGRGDNSVESEAGNAHPVPAD
jgi:3-oxosteroid 1-dehydrogenase